MLKILSFVVLVLFLVGCGPDKNPTFKSGMFQTVDKNQATLVQSGKDKRYCVRCGMDLIKFYKTSHTSTYKDKH